MLNIIVLFTLKFFQIFLTEDAENSLNVPLQNGHCNGFGLFSQYFLCLTNDLKLQMDIDLIIFDDIKDYLEKSMFTVKRGAVQTYVLQNV